MYQGMKNGRAEDVENDGQYVDTTVGIEDIYMGG